MASEKPMGRPPKPEELRRDVLVRVMVTDAERERFQAAAEKQGASLSSWLRMLAVKASENVNPKNTNLKLLTDETVKELFPINALEKQVDDVLSNDKLSEAARVQELKKIVTPAKRK